MPGDSKRFRYAAYEDTRSVPNVVVDGAPNEATVLAVTHWPGIPQPVGLGDDLSAQMAFRYLDAPPPHAPADVVTNNHYDQDGLVSVHALTDPDVALARRDLLVDVAAAGDFGTYRFRDAARASMVIAAYADLERSPIANTLDGLDYPEQCRVLYEETLPLLVAMATTPERFRDLWGEEDDRLSASEKAIADGDVTIDEYPDVDLAVVTVRGDQPRGGGHVFTSKWLDEIHPFALNNATDRFRVLIVSGRRYRYLDRYETWVQYHSRTVAPRVDMTPFAERLTASERGAVRWSAEPPSGILPMTTHDGESSLESGVVVSALRAHLTRAPRAWDPTEAR